MNPPRRLRGAFGMCNLREGFVNLREGFVVAPWRLREAFSKTRSAKASRSPLEGFAKASRRRHGRLHLETIRQIMTSPRQNKIKETNREGSRQKEADEKVACKGHRRQGGTQKRKPRNKIQTKRNKQRITTYNKGRKNVLLGRLRKKGNHRSSARQPSSVRKTRTRTTNAPHSENRRRERGTAIKSK